MKNIRQKIFEKCFFYEKRHCLTQIKVFFFLLLFGNISLMAQNWQILMVTLHWKYLIRMQCLQSHIWV